MPLKSTLPTISKKLRDMYEEKDKYHYNYIGVFLAKFHKNIKRKNYYYCSEFVYEILCEFGIVIECTALRIIRPNAFLGLGLGELKYIGFMRTYQ